MIYKYNIWVQIILSCVLFDFIYKYLIWHQWPITIKYSRKLSNKRSEYPELKEFPTSWRCRGRGRRSALCGAWTPPDRGTLRWGRPSDRGARPSPDWSRTLRPTRTPATHTHTPQWEAQKRHITLFLDSCVDLTLKATVHIYSPSYKTHFHHRRKQKIDFLSKFSL